MTDEQRRFELASVALRRAVEAHTAAVLAAGADAELVAGLDSALGAALGDYAAAQDDLGPAEVPDEQADRVVSVLQRHDYEITDSAALVEAGRAAHRQTWPQEGRAEAARAVSDLGVALYELAHLRGWAALRDAPGVEPVAGIIAVVAGADPLGDDPDTWTEALHVAEDDVVFSQTDLWRT